MLHLRLVEDPEWLTLHPRKFGKALARRQLDIPDYAASFVNYKALKKLIKSLAIGTTSAPDPQAALQANKATFFFRLERELEKVNTFYLQKEAELKLRLRTLSDKKDVFQGRNGTASKVSATYITLREGFKQFEHDLSKLQQFVEINATAFSKILKKWDKSSKSRTKELYISRAVEVQPCFNREVISELSDQASSNLLQLEAWAEGEVEFTQAVLDRAARQTNPEEGDPDAELLNAVRANNITLIKEWIDRLRRSEYAKERVSRVFLASIAEGPDTALEVLINSNFVDFQTEDEINERNCLHEAANSGKLLVLEAGLKAKVDVGQSDVYGRIPLHYAVMHGRVDMIQKLIVANPGTIDVVDHDNFTPLVHAVTNNKRDCVQELLKSNARIDPRHERDYIPLNLACEQGFEDVARVLLERKAKVLPDAGGFYPQHLVARSGRSNGLLALLQKYGANINEADKFFQWTPTFHAASEGHINTLRTLLDLGAQVDAIDERGLSSLYYAAWEGHLDCMKLLASSGSRLGVAAFVPFHPSPQSIASPNSGTHMSIDADGIPSLSLPPPILPLRRYGHNFLENKTLVQLFFEEAGTEAIRLDNESKYPAARLTISSKSSDLIPRNLVLPLNEDSRSISFQVDALESFSIDFDVYPTFGSRIVARTIALADIFRSSNSGHCILPLFDTRLRAIGRLSFDYRIIKPFQGIPLEITHFATYWKATSQLDQHSTTLITGSSLSGDYVRLHIQLTNDLVPVLYREETIKISGLDVPIWSISYAQYLQHTGVASVENKWRQLVESNSPAAGYSLLASSFLSFADVLSKLPPEVHVDLNIVHPASNNSSVNQYVDIILRMVFDHARALKQTSPNLTRAIIFSSSNMKVCTSLNWKQPNYPVFFSNCSNMADMTTVCSMKDAVRFASGNNLMGLVCPSDLLDMVPALVQSVKSSGLVLVASESATGVQKPPAKAVDGVLGRNGVLRFEDTIEM